MKNFIIIILLMISLLLTGYVSYDKVFSNNNEVIIVDQDSNVKQNSNNFGNQLNNKIDISDNNDDNEVSDNSGFMLDAYENIITSDLSKLLGENSLSELSNQDILYMLVEMYKNQNEFPEDFTKEDLDNIHRNSVLRNINFVHEDISDYSIVNEYTGSPLFNYNDSTYIYANTGHSYETLKIVNKELVEIIEKDNEVMLSYKFVFLKQSGNNPVYLKLYSTIDDVRNNKLLEEYTYYDIYDEGSSVMAINKVKKYVELNYDQIKDNLDIYTYVFKNENGNIILKDFYKK